MTISAASHYTFGMIPTYIWCSAAASKPFCHSRHPACADFSLVPCTCHIAIAAMYFCPILFNLHRSQTHFLVPVLSSVTCPICKVLLWRESFSSHIINQIKYTVWLQMTWNKEAQFCSVMCSLSVSQCDESSIVFCTGSAVCLFRSSWQRRPR